MYFQEQLLLQEHYGLMNLENKKDGKCMQVKLE